MCFPPSSFLEPARSWFLLSMQFILSISPTACSISVLYYDKHSLSADNNPMTCAPVPQSPSFPFSRLTRYETRTVHFGGIPPFFFFRRMSVSVLYLCRHSFSTTRSSPPGMIALLCTILPQQREIGPTYDFFIPPLEVKVHIGGQRFFFEGCEADLPPFFFSRW